MSIIILSCIFISGAPRTQAQAQAQTPTGIMVPLFSYVGPTWAQLIAYHQEYPTVPMIAVVSPLEGPGSFRDPDFLLGVQSLQNAGIPVLGYVVSHYANTNISAVEALVADYSNWYHLNGTLIDDMNTSVSASGYYSTLAKFGTSVGMTITVGNPGTDVPQSDVGIVNMTVIYESPGVPSLSFIAGWHANYPKSNFAITAYDVNPLNTTWVVDASRYLGYLYVTNGVWPDPYTNALPSYMNTLMTTLANVDESYASSG
jgi:Spherulation-specific family 4